MQRVRRLCHLPPPTEKQHKFERDTDQGKHIETQFRTFCFTVEVLCDRMASELIRWDYSGAVVTTTASDHGQY